MTALDTVHLIPQSKIDEVVPSVLDVVLLGKFDLDLGSRHDRSVTRRLDEIGRRGLIVVEERPYDMLRLNPPVLYASQWSARSG